MYGNQAGRNMYIDLLVKIKNAEAVGKESVKTPYTKMDHAVADVLRRYGFLKKVEIKGRNPKRSLELTFNDERPIQGSKLLSKPSLRRYSGYSDLRPVKGGYGILVLSTSKGIKSGVEAKKEKLGGQLLFEIW